MSLKPISPATASQLPSALEFPDLPWQISRHAIPKVAAGHAFFSGRALVVLDHAAENSGPIRIIALVSTHRGAVDWAELRGALAAVLRRYPDREFSAAPIFPETFGTELFVPLGFSQEPLSQFLMRRDLGPASR